VRIAGLLVVLVGCSKGVSCPTVDDLARRAGSAVDRDELEVVATRCRADGWSSTVTKCLHDAQNNDMIDPCLKQLTAEQQKRLDEAFEPLNAKYKDKELADVRAHDVAFETKLAELHLDQLTSRAGQCAEFVSAIDTARKAILACTWTDSLMLEQFGTQQLIIAKAKELEKTADADLAVACTRVATELRENAKTVCHH